MTVPRTSQKNYNRNFQAAKYHSLAQKYIIISVFLLMFIYILRATCQLSGYVTFVMVGALLIPQRSRIENKSDQLPGRHNNSAS